MITLNKPTTPDFLNRFSSFNDGILHKIEVSYMSNGKRNISVWIAARDIQQTQKEGWVCIHINILQVGDFCLSENDKSSAQVLSNGIHICWFEEYIGLDFSHFVDSPGSIAELKTSKFYAIGLSAEWSVEPYSAAEMNSTRQP